MKIYYMNNCKLLGNTTPFQKTGVQSNTCLGMCIKLHQQESISTTFAHVSLDKGICQMCRCKEYPIVYL